jgi:hypothetical protein
MRGVFATVLILVLRLDFGGMMLTLRCQRKMCFHLLRCKRSCQDSVCAYDWRAAKHHAGGRDVLCISSGQIANQQGKQD